MRTNINAIVTNCTVFGFGQDRVVSSWNDVRALTLRSILHLARQQTCPRLVARAQAPRHYAVVAGAVLMAGQMCLAIMGPQWQPVRHMSPVARHGLKRTTSPSEHPDEPAKPAEECGLAFASCRDVSSDHLAVDAICAVAFAFTSGRESWNYQEITTEPTEFSLVLAAQDGDREAFGQLAQRYERAVYATALRRLGNHAEAQEVCQEVLVRAMQKISQLREPAGVRLVVAGRDQSDGDQPGRAQAVGHRDRARRRWPRPASKRKRR